MQGQVKTVRGKLQREKEEGNNNFSALPVRIDVVSTLFLFFKKMSRAGTWKISRFDRILLSFLALLIRVILIQRAESGRDCGLRIGVGCCTYQPTMTERLNINKIDKNTEEWTCKVQVVDKGHPRTNREGNKKYQLMILQDEEVIPPEPPLLPPTLLKATSFDNFDYQSIGFEFDILALVINGCPPSYASNGSRIQEFIIIDYQCQFEVTIQDDAGSTTAMISDKIGEELLFLTLAEIHDIRCIKKQLLPLIPVQHKLLEKTFTIQIKKLFAKNKDASSAKLFIMSITEKDIVSNLPLPVTAPIIPESSKRKLKQIMTKKD
ncbi:hypothetical protein H5410_048217 [Solanum commersonii]|uniref:Uncharacterized protein n=1 Tax=Solanum commersonii TaxID=4109 RepID=A0A9J5XJR5_SOLCO|nr:hypothetical protein H5410_048217 [Solanum commersonii]